MKEVKDKLNAVKVHKLAAENKLLEVVVTHSSGKTQIVELLSSVEEAKRGLQSKEEACSKKNSWRRMYRIVSLLALVS